MALPQNIILVGFMGSGKSRVGRELAQRTGWPLVDTDAEIERRAGKPIHRIFAEDSEAVFRALERRVIAQICEKSGQIIAVGGGTFVDLNNRQAMRARGMVFCLSARPETLLRRVSGGKTPTPSLPLGKGEGVVTPSPQQASPVRPLLAGPPEERLGRIQSLLAQRAGAYAQAHHTIETDDLTPGQVAQRIMKLCGMGETV